MSAQLEKTETRKRDASPRETARSLLVFVGFSAVALTIAVVVMKRAPSSDPTALPATNRPPPHTAAAPDGTNAISHLRLVGRWLRPDGGYLLELRNAHSDGRLEAAYFNPSPIRVAQAQWTRETDGLHVMVELRDANYPGAVYRLQLAPDAQLLRGQYYQPALEQTFEIEFRRIPEHAPPP